MKVLRDLRRYLGEVFLFSVHSIEIEKRGGVDYGSMPSVFKPDSRPLERPTSHVLDEVPSFLLRP